MDGLDFLVGQGAKSFEIWTGIAADRNAMLEAVRR
jgi:shikimate 5-dehydrogenase